MIRHLLLVLVAVMLFPAIGRAQTGDSAGTANLQWKLPVGKKMNIVMTQEMKNSQKVGDKSVNTDLSSTSYMTWKVTEVDDAGIATIDSAIDRMTMSMKSPQGEFEIDSDSEEEMTGMAKILGETLVGMVGKPFGQTMDAQGKVLTVDFPAEFKKATMVLGKDAMEKLIKSGSPVFPDKPISVGESWNQETKTPMPNGLGEMRLVSTYTYAGPETVDGQQLEALDIDMQVEFLTPQDSTATINVTSQNTNGKMYFDSVNGHTTWMKVNQEMEMDITMGEEKVTQSIVNNTEGKFSLAQ